MNSESPLVPGPAPSGRASTRWMMFSNRSPESAEVMNRLTPVDVPGAVLLLDRLGAAGADVRAGVRLGQHHGRAPTALGAQHGPLLLLLGTEVVDDVARSLRRPRTSTPRGWRRGRARAAPTAAPWASACRRAPRRRRPCPSRLRCSAWTDFLNDSGSVTEWVFGSNTGGLRSPSTNDSAIGPSASRLISVSISRAVSTSRSLYSPWPNALSTPNTSNRLNTWSRTLLL